MYYIEWLWDEVFNMKIFFFTNMLSPEVEHIIVLKSKHQSTES